MQLNISEIIKRLKISLNTKLDKDLYENMGVSQGTFSNWKKRNAIPFENIISICYKKDLDIKYILSGETSDKKTQFEINYKNEIEKLINELNEKDLEIIYHTIKLKVLENK